MATVADLIVRQLRDAGVHTLFGVPGGGSNLDVIAAAGKAGLPFVLTSTETAGAIAALAQAEVTGKMGACLTTLGPGAASVVNGLACAFLDRAPVVAFTDSHPVAAQGTFEHQRLDHAALLTAVTKSSETLTPDNALQALTRAVHTAGDRRPGPVHLDCPGNVAAAATSSTAATLVGPVRHALSPEDRLRLEGLLARARKPLLLVGLGARRAADAAAIRELCGRRHVPAMVTYKAKGVVPDGHTWFAGVFTNAAIEQPVINDSDLLIGIGLDPVELIPRAWKREQSIVYCGPWTVEDRHVPFAVQLVTDVPNGVQQIEALLSSSEWDPDRVRHDPVVALTGDGGLLMCAGELLTAVRERLRIVTIVFSDASLSLIEIKQQARRLEPSGVALGAIDWPALAGSFGVAAWIARNDAELADAIGKALESSGPSLIEAKIDRSNYGATLRAVRG